MTPRTKAVVAVDIFGYPCELDELRAICDRHGLALVEDACEALGARYKGRPLGSHGHPAVFAFYPNKQITTGEGGAVTTGSAEEHELLVSLRNQGRLETSSWLAARPLRLQLPARRHLGRARDRPAREARPDPRPRAARSPRATRSCSPGVDVELPLADDDDHVRSWFVYVVKLPRRRRPRRADRRARRARASPARRTCRRSTSSRTCASASASARACCPVSEDASARTMAIPFHARLAARGPGAGRRARSARRSPDRSAGRDSGIIRRVADGAQRMIFLGFGKYVRADKIYALEPLPDGQRGHGARTRVWVEGIAEPIVASRTERAIVAAMGANPAAEANRIVDAALDLAQRVADAAEQGRFDVVDLGRRARRLLESTTDRAGEPLLSRRRADRPAGDAPLGRATSSPGASTRSRPS